MCNIPLFLADSAWSVLQALETVYNFRNIKLVFGFSLNKFQRIFFADDKSTTTYFLGPTFLSIIIQFFIGVLVYPLSTMTLWRNDCLTPIYQLLVINSKSRALLCWGCIICSKICSTGISPTFVQKYKKTCYDIGPRFVHKLKNYLSGILHHCQTFFLF